MTEGETAMRSFLGALSSLIVLLAAAGAHAQTPPPPESSELPPRMTLRAAVERALVAHPTVGAARATAEAAAAGRAEARAAWRPTLDLATTVNQSQEPLPVSPIHGFGLSQFPPFDETLIQGTASGSYTLFDGGARRARSAQAEAESGAAGAALGAAEQALAARVASTFLAVLSRVEGVRAVEAQLVALRAEGERVARMLEVGRVAEVELLRIEAALAAAEAEQVRRAAELKVAEQDLARLLDREPSETAADRLEPPAVTGEESPQREPLLAAAAAANPRLAEARARLATAQAAVRLAASGDNPQLRLSAAYNEYGSGGGDFSGEWTAGVRLGLSLYDGGATAARVIRAEAAARGAGEQVRLLEQQIAEEVDRGLAALAEARARQESLGRAVSRYLEVVRVERLLLATGGGIEADYLDSEAALAEARAALAEAGYGVAAARIELAKSAGELTPGWLGARPSIGAGRVAGAAGPAARRATEP